MLQLTLIIRSAAQGQNSFMSNRANESRQQQRRRLFSAPSGRRRDDGAKKSSEKAEMDDIRGPLMLPLLLILF